MRNFTKGQALRNAIDAETVASRFYGLLSERVEGIEAQTFLHDVAAAEQAIVEGIVETSCLICPGELPNRASENVEAIRTAPEWARVRGVGLDTAQALVARLQRHASSYYALCGKQLAAVPEAFFFEHLSRALLEHALMVETLIVERRAAQCRTLPLSEALQLVFQTENASARFYKAARDRAVTEQARRFFGDMLAVEETHGTQLQMLRRSMESGRLACNVDTLVMVESGGPDWSVPETSDLSVVLKAAMDAETKASHLFQSVAKQVGGEEALVLEDLAKTEEEHAMMIWDAHRHNNLDIA